MADLRETISLDTSAALRAVAEVGRRIDGLAKTVLVRAEVRYDIPQLDLPTPEVVRQEVAYDVPPLDVPNPDPEQVPIVYDVPPLEVPAPGPATVPVVYDVPQLEVPAPDAVIIPVRYDYAPIEPPPADPVTIPVAADTSSALTEISGFTERTNGMFGSIGSTAGAALGATGLGNPAKLGAAAAGAAIGGFLLKSGTAFTNFERGVLQTFTLLDDSATVTYDQMAAAAISFANQAGQPVLEVVEATYEAISAGVPADNVFDFLETAAQAAVAGNTNLLSTVTGLTSVVNAYGSVLGDSTTAADDFQAASDVMFATINYGNTTFEQLSAQLADVTPIAAALKIPFEDVGGAIATITSIGVPTSEAMTQIKSALAELSQPTSKAAETFQQLAGVTFPEFIQQGGTMQEAFDLMRAEADRMNVPVNALFGSIRAGAAVMNTTGPELGARMTEFSEKTRDATGSSARAFEIMSDSAGFQFDRLKATVTAGLIATGERFTPFLAQVAGFAADTLPKVRDFVQQAVDLYSQFAGKVADVVGPVFGTFIAPLANVGRLAQGVRGIIDTFRSGEDVAQGLAESVDFIFGNTGRLVGPVRSAIERVGELVGTVRSLWDEFGSPVAAAAVEGVSSAVASVASGLAAASDAVGAFIDRVLAMDEVQSAISSARDLLGTIVQAAIDVFNTVVGLVSEVGPNLLSIAGLAFILVRNIFDVGRDLFRSIVDLVVGVFEALAPRIRSVIDGLGPVFSAIVGLVSPAIDLIAAVVQRAVDIFQFVVEVIKVVGDVAVPVAAVVVAVVSKIADVIGSVLGSDLVMGTLRTLAVVFGSVLLGAVRAIIGVLDNLFRAVGDIIGAFARLLQGDPAGFFTGIFNAVRELLGGLGELVANILGSVVDVFYDLGSQINQALGGALGGAFNFVVTWAGGIIEFFTTFFSGFAAIVQAGWDVIVSVTSVVWEAVSTVIGTFLTFIVGNLNAVLQIILATWTYTWGLIGPVVTFFLEVVWAAIQFYLNLALGFIGAVLEGIRFTFEVVWNAISAIVGFILPIILSIIQTTWNTISSITSTVFNAVRTVIEGAINGAQAVISVVVTGWGVIFDAARVVIETATGLVVAAIDTVKGPAQAVYDLIATTLGGITSSVFSGISAAFGFIGDAAGIARDAVEKLVGWIQDAIDLAGRIPTPGDIIPGDIPFIPGIASGGVITGAYGVGQVVRAGEAGPELFVNLTSSWQRQKELLHQAGILERLWADFSASEQARLNALSRGAPAAVAAPHIERIDQSLTVNVRVEGAAVDRRDAEQTGRHIGHAAAAVLASHRRRIALKAL